MDRDRIFRIHQRIDQLDILSARMSRYMNILKDDICTLAHQIIDDTGNRFLVTRNRVRTEHDRIVRLNGYLTVCTGCHAG